MKCQCSLDNNYEIIELCDIEKFNEKVNEFKDKSWTQITIPEKVTIPSNKPSVKTIMKIYLDIKITSTKIIESPLSNEASIEGLMLTGKLLLVSGEICQNILYISETLSNSIHSLKINNHFSTYIVIKENVELENENYSIYPYIEDVTVKRLNERTLSKNLNLFLFIHILPKTPVLFNNAFIFNTFDTNREMARIEFDKANKKLIVTSTELPYNNSTVIEAYKFELLSSDERTIKASQNIKGVSNANEFKDNLNDISFNYNDIIILTFKEKNKITLTNYPKIGNVYSMLAKHVQSFKITQTGIIPNVLSNQIMLNNTNSQSVIDLQFDISTLGFLTNSTGNITDNGTQNYFKMTLLDNTGGFEKLFFAIPGRTEGGAFKTYLDNQRYKFDDIIKLEYEDNSKVIITNFPNLSTPSFSPSGNRSYFLITKDGFVASRQKISNAFILKTLDSNEEMVRIEFDVNTKKLRVTSTGKIYSSRLGDLEVFTFLISTITGRNATSAMINANQNANIFRDKLNELPFEYDYVIRIRYNNKSKIELTEYPSMQSNYSMISESVQSFKITPFGIFPNLLRNQIKVKNSNGLDVIIIYFDFNIAQILVISTGNFTDAGGENYFKLSLFRRDGITQKIASNISGNSNGNNFKNTINDQVFEFNDILKLEYENNNQILITNFPDFETPNYKPKRNSEYFIILQNGLISRS